MFVIKWIQCQTELNDIDCMDDNFSLMNTLSLGIYNKQIYQYTLDHMLAIYPIRYFGKKIQLRGGMADYIYVHNKGLLLSDTFKQILDLKRNLINRLTLATFKYENVNFFKYIYLDRKLFRQTILLTQITEFIQNLKPIENTYLVHNTTKKILAIWMEDNNERMYFLDFFPNNDYDLVLINETKFESKKYVCLNEETLTMSFTIDKCSTKTNFFDIIRFAFSYQEYVYLVSITKQLVYYFEEQHLHLEGSFQLKQMNLMELFSCSTFEKPTNNDSWIFYAMMIILLLILFISAIFTIIYTLLIKRKSFNTTNSSESSKMQYYPIRKILTPMDVGKNPMDPNGIETEKDQEVSVSINMAKLVKIFRNKRNK